MRRRLLLIACCVFVGTACANEGKTTASAPPRGADLLADFTRLVATASPQQQQALLGKVMALPIEDAYATLVASGSPVDAMSRLLASLSRTEANVSLGQVLGTMNILVTVPTVAEFASSLHQPTSLGLDDNQSGEGRSTVYPYSDTLCQDIQNTYEQLSGKDRSGAPHTIGALMGRIASNGVSHSGMMGGNLQRQPKSRTQLRILNMRQLRSYFYWCYTDQQIIPNDNRDFYPDPGDGGASSGATGGASGSCDNPTAGGSCTGPGTWHPNADYFDKLDGTSGYNGYGSMLGTSSYSG